MNLQEEIKKQIKAGFSNDEIRNNLIDLGFDQQEVSAEMKDMSKYPKPRSSSGTDMKTIGGVVLGLIIIIRIIVRIFHLAD